MMHSRTTRRLLALLLAVCAVTASTEAGWLRWCRRDEPHAEYAPCLPNSGYHATRWSRWSEPAPCDAEPVSYPEPAYAPPPPAPLPGHAWGTPLDASAGYANPSMPAPLPLPYAPTSRSMPSPEPAEWRPAMETPALEPQHPSLLSPREDAPEYQTREWSLSSSDVRTSSDTIRVSHETSPSNEFAPSRRATANPLPRLQPNPVGRPGSTGYYRYDIQPAAPR